ncbi:dihydrolipoamide acetyltransferase family protein [Arcticibacter eurypsychrophilus]|uniref:dihydrolipoamide acetyltransferase family protein n=1 Tax=Arcticibacter eurypsychrophilus TaxID=1434752 RepID=UPI00084D3E3F|nr:dihydrolipoamide acetyltransferase family protein [Arcticibacter eurypsychrophilus]
MAQFELVLPKMGESVAEATIIKWLKNPGDMIQEDEPVVEIATDKVDSEVPSPISGKLISQSFKIDDIVNVGAVLALIETEEITPPVSEIAKPLQNTAPVPDEAEIKAPGIDQVFPEKSVHINFENASRFYSPLVKSIAAEEGISLEQLDEITGTGLENRVTKQDILDYIKEHKKPAIYQQQVEAQPTTEVKPDSLSDAPSPVFQTASFSGGDEIIEMDRMRRMIAEHMVMSKQTAPHVTSFIEADVTNIVKWRERIKSSFEKREGQKLTYTPIFIQAVAKAISEMPMINVSVKGTQIIKKKNINIGMAAALPSGNLIVPVIKNADQLSLIGLTRAVNDLASRARANKLLPDDVQDGTFTLTNIGSFGNVMGVPIINQPQVAILAVGAIQKKPAVMETEFGDVIAIRHKMFLSMSYDHRVVDGALGGMFIKRVAEYLENWDMNYTI